MHRGVWEIPLTRFARMTVECMCCDSQDKELQGTQIRTASLFRWPVFGTEWKIFKILISFYGVAIRLLFSIKISHYRRQQVSCWCGLKSCPLGGFEFVFEPWLFSQQEWSSISCCWVTLVFYSESSDTSYMCHEICESIPWCLTTLFTRILRIPTF